MIEILKMIGITFIPTLELRASVPYGIFYTEFHWLTVFVITYITNIILGVLVFTFLDLIMKILLKIPFVSTFWEKYVEKTRKKIHAGVEKYGEWAIVVFIGIPLPGSGVYTGALASYLIGLSPKKFFVANILGVLIAGIAMTVICLTLGEASVFLKQI